MKRVKVMNSKELEVWEMLRLEVDWALGHEAMSVSGEQDLSCEKTEKVLTLDEFSSKLGTLFEMETPRVVHFCAAGDRARVIEAWKGTESRAFIGDAKTYRARSDHENVPEMTRALAMTDFASLTLELDDMKAKDKPVTEMSGFLFSTLISGRSVCKLSGERCESAVREAKYKELELKLNWASNSKIAAICSAAAESPPVESLRIFAGVIHYEAAAMSLTRWGWLMYGLCSSVSTVSDKMLHGGTKISSDPGVFVRHCRSAKTNYPEPIRAPGPTGPREYGFLTVPEGTELRLGGLTNEGSNTTFVLSRSHRCRALYNPATMTDCVDAVVPGYGICRLKLNARERAKQFVHDNPAAAATTTTCQPERSRRLRELSLMFSSIVDESLVARMLSMIGGGLRQLRLNYFGSSDTTVDLADVAAACPGLKDLQLIWFNVVIMPSQELHDWGIKELSIDGCRSVPCLKDPNYRMSRELLKLVVATREEDSSSADISALKTHDKEPLPLVKEKFPLHSKTAMISVVMSSDGANRSAGHASAIHLLDSVLLGLIFKFAATPKQRTVEVGSKW